MNQIASFLRTRSIDRKACSGQSLVEFALLLPVFLMLVMGVLDISRAYSALQVVTNAAREGAPRRHSANGGSQRCDHRREQLSGLGGQAGCNKAGANWGNAAAAGANTTVTVTCNFQTLTGTVVPGWTGTIALTQTASMRHE